jgi:RimJ/RimL family protein N-acetyltransferase
MPLSLVEVSDAHFAWMLGGPAPAPELRLPPGGVDEPAVIEVVRRMASKVRIAASLGGMIVVDGEVVGLCGSKAAPTPDGVIEIGYGVARSRRGRGYATQAVAALVEAARHAGNIRRLLAETAAHIASQRVLERNGFSRKGARSDPEDGDMIIWHLEMTAAD